MFTAISTKRLTRHRTALRCLFATTILFSALAAPDAQAQNNAYYSYFLRNTPFATNPELSTLDPNTMFSYDPTTRTATTTSQSFRLANAINAQIPGALVDAFSYGYGAICLAFPHGDLFFSISRLPGDGGSAALPGSALYYEANDDCESDLWWVPNVPATNPNFTYPNVKAADDNTAPGVRRRFSALPYSELGVHGKYGHPNNSPPAISNLAAFDHHPHQYAGSEDLYFSIAEDYSGPGGNFESGDILRLNAQDNISVFRHHWQIGLSASDNIDALSIDLHHSDDVNQCRCGLLSVTRDSPFSSGGDIHLFFCDDNPLCQALSTGIYRWASASGIHPGDGDIDCIVSIDPRTSWTNKPLLAAGQVVLVLDAGQPSSYSVVVDGATIATELGTSTAVPASFGPGDSPLIQTWGTIGEVTRFGGTCKYDFDVGAFLSVSDLGSTVGGVGGSSAELTWTNPIGTDATEVQLNDEPPLSLGAVTSLTLSSLDPGIYVAAVRAIDGGGTRSLPEYTQFEIEQTLPMPSELDVQITGAREITVSWVHDAATTEIEVRLDGTVVASIAPVVGSTTGSIVLTTAGYGYHRISLRASATGQSSAESPTEVFLPRPLPGTILQSAPYSGLNPYGMTYVPEFGEILINERSNPTAYYYDPDTLQPGSVPSITNPLGVGIIAVTGVTVGNPSLLVSDLVWVVRPMTVSGNSQLYTSDSLGSGLTPIGELGFAMAGDISVHPDLTGGYIVSNLVDLEYSAVDVTGAPLAGVGSFTNPAPAGIQGAVAARKDTETTIVVPTAFGVSGVTSHFTTFEMSGTARTQSTLEPIAGAITGMVYRDVGSQGVPSIYCVTDALMIYEIAAHERVPTEEDCHLPVFGGISGRNNTPVPIPDDLDAGVESTITLSESGTVADVDVVVSLTHEQVSDLTLELISPTGTAVTLQSGVLPYQETMTARYDDIYMGAFNDNYGDRSTSGPGQLSDFDGETIDGTWTLRLIDDRLDRLGDLAAWQILICPSSSPTPTDFFVRADINGDEVIDLADGISLLVHLFGTGPPLECTDAADVNDDGAVNVADVIRVLDYLFGSILPIPDPFPTCGPDPTPDGLACDSASGCP